jgi:hypothetical protein
MVTLEPEEMDTLLSSWQIHRNQCRDARDMKIEHRPGGGIGTRTIAVCGCGTELDVTNYYSW